MNDMPKALARLSPAGDRSDLSSARVAAVEPDGSVLLADQGGATARQATSCLLAPQAGDLVLVARTGAGAGYVLAVLERPDAGTATLTVPGAAAVTLRQASVEVEADSFRLSADAAAFRTRALTLVGDTLSTAFGKVERAARSLSEIVEQRLSRFGTSIRVVDELDSTDAAKVDLNARDTLTVRTGTAVVAAEHDVRIDGERIHLG